MFTGIVEELGLVVAGGVGRLRVAASAVLAGVEVGDSLAVDGCCLTVVARGEDWWEADLSEETRHRTTLGRLRPGTPVNLERPLRLDGRLGGHLVQGHVDGVGEVRAPAPSLAVRLAPELARYIAARGSVAVDGVSLTVTAVGADGFAAAVIPHTAAVTTLGRKGPGEGVNVEVDVLARYAERLLVGVGATGRTEGPG